MSYFDIKRAMENVHKMQDYYDKVRLSGQHLNDTFNHLYREDYGAAVEN